MLTNEEKEVALDSLERTDRCRFTGKAIRYG
jgi:hypothetical protein